MLKNWEQLIYTEAVMVNPRVHLEKGKPYPFLDMASVDPSARCAWTVEWRSFTGGGARFAVGDTLLARITPCLENGKIARYCAQLAHDAHGSTEFIVIRGRENITDSAYAYYLTKWEGVSGYAISQMTGTSGRQRVPTESLSNLIVPVPPLPEQRRIAHILGTLDDKIENNRKTAKSLEAMAQAIFKSWFVDFDPVRAKMNGEPPESICKRLKITPDILDLFPDRLVDSELGEIPEGWVLNPISEIIEFNPAMPIKKNVSAPYLDMASLPTAGCWPADPVFRPYSSGMRFQNGDTLLARITPCLENGKTAYIQCLKDHGVGWGSTEFIVMRPKPPVPSVVAYLIARNDKLRAHAIQGMTGTSGRQRVQVTTVSDFQVIQPDNASIWPYFGSISVSLFDNIKSFSKENLPLIKLRDTLLPKLISGEIRVPEAEHLIEKAAV